MSNRKLFKAFVADADMFNAVKAFVLSEPTHRRKDGESLQDFGARVDAYNQLRSDLSKRFDAIKIEAERDIL